MLREKFVFKLAEDLDFFGTEEALSYPNQQACEECCGCWDEDNNDGVVEIPQFYGMVYANRWNILLKCQTDLSDSYTEEKNVSVLQFIGIKCQENEIPFDVALLDELRQAILNKLEDMAFDQDGYIADPDYLCEAGWMTDTNCEELYEVELTEEQTKLWEESFHKASESYNGELFYFSSNAVAIQYRIDKGTIKPVNFEGWYYTD